jgi:hypothetical protein
MERNRIQQSMGTMGTIYFMVHNLSFLELALCLKINEGLLNKKDY